MGAFMRCKVIFLNKKQQVPVKRLGEEWTDIASWLPEFKQFVGKQFPGKVLIDGNNKVAICGVMKFRTSVDTVSVQIGLDYLKKEGYEPEVIEL